MNWHRSSSKPMFVRRYRRFCSQLRNALRLSAMKPLSLVLTLSLLATSTALAYTEFAPDARTGPAAFQQTGAVVAAHGGDYLAAWTTNAPYPFGSSVWIALV